MSENRIEIARAVKGDRAALDALLRRHLDDLYRFCLRLLWSDDVAARDLAQETLVQAIAGIGAFRAESSFRTWLFAIAHNLYRRDLRAKKLRREKLDQLAEVVETAVRGADDAASGGEQRELVQMAFNSLAPGQRDALYLREILGCTYAETAEILGISVNAAKNRIHEGRKRMMNCVNERVVHPDDLRFGHG